MTLSTVLAAAALACPQEARLQSMLPDVFAKSAAHYRSLDAAATPLMNSGDKVPKVPHGWKAAEGKLDMRSIYWWTSGHFPGSLWYLYEATGDAFFKDRATVWTKTVAPNSKVTDNHDIGFIMYCSFGNARRLLKTDMYDALLLETAESLSKRFNERLGLIRSWGALDEKKDFLVIPDNMMNLELLEWAAKAKGGDSRFDEIARSHATKTMAYHFRADGGTYHVLDYDQETLRVKGIMRGQGASCETAWSRGQAWAIYGYTMMYRETKDPAYLAFAQKVSDFAIGNPNMPEDGVPYWDFGAPGEERDSSAAAVMASGLLELATFVPGEKGAAYRAFAVKQLLSLCSDAYFAQQGENGDWLLKHGVGHKPAKSEIDTPLDYGDYYFLEALLRFRRECVAKDSDLMAAVAVSSPGLEPGDERALADRLFMHWNTHATDVFVRDEAVVGVGGARADVPTVMFAGNRSHVTQFRRPKIEELPRRFEDERGILLEPADGGEKTFVPYGKTGCMISSVNREIVSKARDAARKWAKDGDEFSARLAFNVLDTYLAGILARNVATDLGRGHLQTLFGLQSMETIHDDIIHEITELYSLLLPWLEKNAADRIDVYKAALRKWADVQIANGVADNNWDMMQLNYILEIGLALGGEDKAHYVDAVMNQSSVRNYSVKKLAETGFDPDTGIWWECPGYSVGVTLKDFAKFATRAKKDLGIDLLEEVPVLKKAFPAAGEYLFPDGLLIGFGDTHPSRIPDEVLAYAKTKSSPFFYAPNASWLVARSGMDPTNDVAFALNGSLGNHQHANGISLELYARGYRLAPDAGIGWTLYSGDDYKEYYSQFPAHNTVMVDSRSTYQVMKSFHPFELVAHGDNWATVRFREPATNAEQERTVRYVKDGEGAYFVDVFRSRAKGARWHDYYYHNFGDTLSLNGETEPTEEIAFVESGLYALSYIKDKEARKGRGDLVATFDWKRPEGIVTTRLFMNDAEGRTFFKASAPATEGLSRVKSPNYGITRDSRTPCLVVRQRDEAWDRPFVAVIDPCGTVKGVEFLKDSIRVTRPSGKTDAINLNP